VIRKLMFYYLILKVLWMRNWRGAKLDIETWVDNKH